MVKSVVVLLEIPVMINISYDSIKILHEKILNAINWRSQWLPQFSISFFTPSSSQLLPLEVPSKKFISCKEICKKWNILC